MSLERITKFQSRMDQMKDPRVRRGFIDSFHARLIQGDIYGLAPEAIDLAAKIEEKYGFEPHSKKLLNHPAYKENERSMHGIDALENMEHVTDDFAYRDNVERGVERGLIPRERADKAYRIVEDRASMHGIDALENMEHVTDDFAYRDNVERGVERGLIPRERADKAYTLVEARRA